MELGVVWAKVTESKCSGLYSKSSGLWCRTVHDFFSEKDNWTQLTESSLRLNTHMTNRMHSLLIRTWFDNWLYTHKQTQPCVELPTLTPSLLTLLSPHAQEWDKSSQVSFYRQGQKALSMNHQGSSSCHSAWKIRLHGISCSSMRD